MTTLINEKLFRVRENENKIRFILKHTDITLDLIQKAAVVATRPPFHTFGHMLGATEQAIRIAQAEGRSRQEINLLALTMIFHDAGHKGIVHLYDEMYSFELTAAVLQEQDTEISGMQFGPTLGKVRDLIIATTFSNRGNIHDPLALIAQDADLAHIGLGVPYWLWGSMGLVDEFSKQRNMILTPEAFIREEQEKFVKFLASLSGTGKVYLSDGANRILRDPLKDVEIVKNVPSELIRFAYDVRKEDITLAEFEAEYNTHMGIS